MEIRKFQKQYEQGDLFFRKANGLPEQGLTKVEPVDGRYIIAWSANGNHHSITAGPGVSYYKSEHPRISYVVNDSDVIARHEKTGPHAHDPVLLSAGVTEVRRQREMRPSGWENVND